MDKDARCHRFVTMQSRGVVALPRGLRRRLPLDVPGAQLELSEREAAWWSYARRRRFR